MPGLIIISNKRHGKSKFRKNTEGAEEDFKNDSMTPTFAWRTAHSEPRGGAVALRRLLGATAFVPKREKEEETESLGAY